MENKIQKLFYHLKRGTITRRVVFEKLKKEAKVNQTKWESFEKSDQQSIKTTLFDCMELNLYKDSNLSKNLIRGDFEYHEIKFLESFLKPNDTFVDIGANIGYFSIMASKFVGPKGAVYAFEPTDVTYQRLLDSIELNQSTNIVSFKTALSDKHEKREFVTSNDGFDAYNSLGNPSQGKDFTRNIVETYSFDSFLKLKNIDFPTLIKIDVEGWEIPVIEGMKELLSGSNSPLLMVEFTEENAQLSGFSCSKLFELISDFGYHLYKYNWVKNELVKQHNKEYFSYSNLIAIKDEKYVSDRIDNILIH